MFRGFAMTQARDAGAPLALQIVLSAIPFGLAHLSTATIGGKFDLIGGISAVIAPPCSEWSSRSPMCWAGAV
jgi:membrane protease YdiL (CAAX protease family)